jgi:hypothetical protein
MMGNKIRYPTYDPYHQAALAKSAKNQQAGRQHEQHSRFPSHEFGGGKSTQEVPGVPGYCIHALQT